VRASFSAADPRTAIPDSREAELEAALAAAQAGDSSAFALLYRDTQPRLLRYASSLVGQDAEDVTAEAWLQIARDLRKFDGDVMGFRGWSVTIVRNRAFDHLRSVQRRPTTPLEEFFLDRPSEPDAAAVATDNISTAAAIRLIGSLPPDQAEAVLLRVVVGLDAATAARILGKRAGAVRVAAHRGLRGLAKILAEREEARQASQSGQDV
jgi:RNA polymerase sigma-70 factor (ECF subfamily)